MTGIAYERRRRPDRRVGAASFRYPERRTGFRRRERRPYDLLLEGYRARPWAVASVILSFVVLNAADLVLTVRALELGATEANPAMAALFGLGTPAAAVFKLAMACGVAAVLLTLRRYRLILETSLALTAAFAALLAYHLTGLGLAP